jgi:hypothetical protein
LPAGCRRIQSLGDAQGQSWQGFHGPGPIQDWLRHFDDWFQQQNWQPLRPWSKTGSTWTAAFQSAEAGQQAEIWLHQKTDGEWEGMAYSAPLNGKK